MNKEKNLHSTQEIFNNQTRLTTCMIVILLCLFQAAKAQVDSNATNNEFIMNGNLTDNLFLTSKIQRLPAANYTTAMPLEVTLNSSRFLNNSNLGEETTEISKTGKVSPLGNRDQCTVSRDELAELNNQINDSLSSAAGASFKIVTCTLSPTDDDSDNCIELIKLLKCGVNHLSDGFLRAVANKATSDDVRKWNNAYEELLKVYENKKDNLNKSVVQKYQREFDELKTKLNDLSRELRDARSKLSKNIKELCISEIASGKIDKAIEHYEALHNSSMLYEIIRSVYTGYGKGDRLENITNFIKELPDCSQIGVAYSALSDILKSNNHLYSPKILFVFDAMVLCAFRGFSNFRDLKTDVISTLAYNIRANQYGQIKEFGEIYLNILRDNLGELISQAYANNVANAEAIINFIRNLNYLQNSIACSSFLFEQMQRNGHLDSYELIMLAYRIKELMEMEDYRALDQKYKDKAINIKINLPNSVLRLVWFGWRCTIINKHHNEYLYAAGNYYVISGKYRRVFAWRSGEHPGEKEAYWDFVPYNNSESLEIKSTYYNESMLSDADNSSYDAERRKILTMKDGFLSKFWRIEPVNDAKYFRIFNTYYNDYLYADGELRHVFDSERRNVFTWKRGDMYGTKLEESKWIINC